MKAINSMSDLRIAWYNLENLFEPEKHPELKASWTPNRYKKKIKNLAELITTMHDGKGPQLLGVCEVASERILRDLIAQLPSSGDYAIVHEDSPDVREIDVGIIYRKSAMAVSDEGAIANNIRKRYPTRDILDVHFRVTDGSKFHVIANHWPARSNGQYASEPFRILVAENCAWIVSKHYAEDKDANILVMGDFNDEPFNRSVQEYLFAIRNRQRVATRRGGLRSRPYLYNLMWDLMDDPTPGTYYYGDNPTGWNMLDQMMVSKGLLTGKQGLKIHADSIGIFRPDMIRVGSKPKPFRKVRNKWVFGYSDHFPITVKINLL